MKIYVASSWRNPWQVGVVQMLRDLGHAVYDFRNPSDDVNGFAWSDIDPQYKAWSAAEYRDALRTDRAEEGFELDMSALRDCDACVLVLPCGSSAHLELGWAIGAGKKTAVLFPFDVVTPSGSEGIAIHGHTMSANGGPCGTCGDLDGCWQPARLHKIEPELMAKCADAILINADELRAWVSAGEGESETAPAHEVIDLMEALKASLARSAK